MNRRWLLAPAAVWLASLFLIQLLGAFATPASVMPDDCPEGSQNCARAVMAFDAHPEDVLAAAVAWEDPRVLVEGEGFAHVVHHTDYVRYPDDLFIKVNCNENGTWLYLHSESRLGISDLGVNQERIDRLLSHLEELTFETHEC